MKIWKDPNTLKRKGHSLNEEGPSLRATYFDSRIRLSVRTLYYMANLPSLPEILMMMVMMTGSQMLCMRGK